MHISLIAHRERNLHLETHVAIHSAWCHWLLVLCHFIACFYLFLARDPSCVNISRYLRLRTITSSLLQLSLLLIEVKMNQTWKLCQLSIGIAYNCHKSSDSSWEQRKNNPSSSAFILPLLVSRIFASPNSSACKCCCPLFVVVVVKLSLGGIAAGRAKGDQVLSEGQAAHHRSGGEHERLCLSVMQGYCLITPSERGTALHINRLLHLGKNPTV